MQITFCCRLLGRNRFKKITTTFTGILLNAMFEMLKVLFLYNFLFLFLSYIFIVKEKANFYFNATF